MAVDVNFLKDFLHFTFSSAVKLIFYFNILMVLNIFFNFSECCLY